MKRTRHKRKHRREILWTSIFLGFSVLTSPNFLLANPQYPTVIAGNATIVNPDASTMHINTSDQAIINWKNFSINAGELTQFIQPSKESAVLNRVTGGDLSSILGTLKANGHVYLINPNGLIFGKEAVINTAGFIASTLDVLDEDFLKNNDLVFKGDSKATITNFGTITAENGDVILLGYYVDNQGQINAKNGVGGLVAGQEVVLSVASGSERITIRPKLPVNQAEKTDTGIDNSGTINALKAELRADGNPYALAINHRGHIDALGIQEKNGQVYLFAENGVLNISGEIIAKNETQLGGDVFVLGEKISLIDKASIDVSGDFGGGSVFVGGDFQGKNLAFANAESIYVGPEVNINSDAHLQGNAGRTIIWADDSTQFHGNISARGGVEGGDGGFVEVSGKKYLGFTGKVNRLALNGKSGTLLLDPISLQITAATDTALGTISNVHFPIASPAQISVGTLQGLLLGGPVILQTGADSSADVGDIIWFNNASLTMPAGSFDLTLSSIHDIVYSGQIINNSDTANIIFNAINDVIFDNNTVASSPSIFSSGAGNNLHGDISIFGDNVFMVGDVSSITVATGAGNLDITARNGNFVAQNTTSVLSRGGGDVTINSFLGDINVSQSAAITTAISGTGSINLNAPQGSLNILGQNSVSMTEINSLGDVNIRVGKNCLLNGGTGGGGTRINASQTINLTTGNDCLLEGGLSTNAFALLLSDKLNLTAGNDFIIKANPTFVTNAFVLNETGCNISVTNNLILDAGIGFAGITMNSGANSINAGNLEMFGNLGNTSISVSGTPLNINVQRNLQMFGGTVTGASATISSVGLNLGADLNFSIGGDLFLKGGSGPSSHVQIGTPDPLVNPVTISFSNIGGSAVLEGGSGTNAYVQIGNGINTVSEAEQGNITFNNGPGNYLTLSGGLGAGSFVQIGHQSLTPGAGPIIGNIRINNVGKDISLNPLGNYAIIGHGSPLLSITQPIKGDISVTSTAGSIYLNPGTSTPQASSIAHTNSSVSISGDVSVSAPLGKIQVQGGSSAAVIGSLFGGQFQGKINVVADNIQLMSGSGIASDAVIGIFGFESTLSPTSVNVITTNDIFLQANGASNATIGYFAPLGTSSTSVLDTIDVTSSNGNLLLTTTTGATGIAVVGTFAPTNLAFFPQGQVSINVAKNIELAPVSNAGVTFFNGGTYISNTGFDVNGTPISVPFDLSINAQQILMGGTAIAQISSGRDLSIKTVNDLRLNAGLGQAVISNIFGTMTFDIGEDLILNGGATVNAIAQIGLNNNTIGSILFENVGGSVLMQGGPGGNAYAIIGHGGFNTGSGLDLIGDIIFKNVNGNFMLNGGSGPRAFAHVGHTGANNAAFTTTINGNINIEKIGNSLTLAAGNNLGSSASIGHGDQLSIESSASYTGQINVNANQINLLAGVFGNAVIGFDNSNPVSIINSPGIDVRANQSISLIAGAGSNSIIGFLLPSAGASSIGTVNNINVQAAHGDITITGGNALGALSGVAGIVTQSAAGVSQSNMKISTPKNVILTNPSLAGPAMALIANSNSLFTSQKYDISIDPLNIILLGGSNSASTASIFSGGNLALNFKGELDVNYDISNPATLQAGAATVIAGKDILINPKGSYGDINVVGGITQPSQIVAGNNLRIGAPCHPGVDDVLVGLPTMGATAQLIALDGDLFLNAHGVIALNGGSTGIAPAQISASGSTIVKTLQTITLTGSSTDFAELLVLETGDLDVKSGVDVIMNQNSLIENQGNGDTTVCVNRDLILSENATIQNIGNGYVRICAGRDIDLSDSSLIKLQGELSIDSMADLILSQNASIKNLGNGNTDLKISRDFDMSNSAILQNLGNGDLTAKVGRDTNLSNNALIQEAAGNLVIKTGRDFNLSQNARVENLGHRTLEVMAGENVNLSQTSSLVQSGGGDLLAIANFNMNLTDASTVHTNGGNLTLVVDNQFPNPPFLGTGRIFKGAGVNITSGTGAVRIFTSRQPFNTILGTINGVPFIPGPQFVNTATERWGTYYETAILGVPFTIFYKDNGVGVPIVPVPHINSRVFHQLEAAFAEAFQEWRYLDYFIFESSCACIYYDAALFNRRRMCKDFSNWLETEDQCIEFIYPVFRTFNLKGLDKRRLSFLM